MPHSRAAPHLESDGDARAYARPKENAIRMNAFRILIADDDPLARLDLRELLTAMGHTIDGEASDGEMALEMARDLRPDLVILDIRMPGLDGLEVARRLADEQIAPALILSAYTDEEYLARVRESGCLSYLVKPFRPTDLGLAIIMSVSLGNRLSAMRDELERLQESLASRKVIERAKGLLMESHGLREQDAFRAIQQESMDSRRSMREVSEVIIAAIEGPECERTADG